MAASLAAGALGRSLHRPAAREQRERAAAGLNPVAGNEISFSGIETMTGEMHSGTFGGPSPTSCGSCVCSTSSGYR